MNRYDERYDAFGEPISLLSPPSEDLPVTDWQVRDRLEAQSAAVLDAESAHEARMEKLESLGLARRGPPASWFDANGEFIR